MLLATVVVAGALASSSPAAAAGGEGETTVGGLRVIAEAGYEGRYLPGRRVPVRVTIEADRLLRGAVEVTLRDQVGSWTRPVEVPAGTTKTVTVVVPTPVTVELDDVRVKLLGTGENVALTAELEPLDDVQVVGLLPGATPPDLPAPLALAMDAGTAHFVALDDATLALFGALDPVGTVAAATGEVGRLDAGARAGLLDWVEHGGRLVVDGAAGTEIAGLPDSWQPGANGRRTAGLGEVRAVGGAVAAGRWADAVEPTPTASIVDLQQLGGMQVPQQFEATSTAVARDAGLEALELPWLLAFLAAYVVLVGPLAWLALRRWRPAFGWLLVPALAAIFTAGSFVVGSDLRSGTRAAHGTVLEQGTGGVGRLTSVVGTVSRSGDDGISRFPAGWSAGTVQSNAFFGGFGFFPGEFGGGFPQREQSGGDLGVTLGAENTEAVVPLAAGGFDVVVGAGPTTVDGDGLVLEAHAEGRKVVGTIRNETGADVERVAVFIGRKGEQLGTIAAGATEEFEFEGNELAGGDPYTPPENLVWSDEIGWNTGTPDFDSIVNVGLWTEVLMTSGTDVHPRGVVTAVAWTRSFSPGIEVVGQDRPEGRTAIVARAPVTVGSDGAVPFGAARRDLIRAPEGIDLPDLEERGQFGGIEGAMWRFVLPEGAVGPYTVDIPNYILRLEVWNGAAWVPVDDDEGSNLELGDPAQRREAALPASVGADGVVWVRGWLTLEFGAFDGVGLELRSVGAT